MARHTGTRHASEPAEVEPENLPAVAEPEFGELALAAPDWMKTESGKGLENLDNSDFELPRLKLLQGLSKEVQERDDTRAGWFFHTAAEQSFSKPFLAVPIFIDRRYLLWRPLENGGGILARADDGVHWQPANVSFDVKLDKKDGGHRVVWKTAKTVKESGLAEWGTHNPNDPNSAPAATLMINMVLAFPEHPDVPPAVLTFQRTSIRNGKSLASKIRVANSRAAIYGMVIRFAAVDDVNANGQKFFNIQGTMSGFLANRAQYDQYAELNKQFAQTGIAIKDVDSMQHDTPDGEVYESKAPNREDRPEI